MTTPDILTQATAAGLTFALEPPDRLRVTGPAEVRERWLPVIRERKAELVTLLSAPPPLSPETLKAIEEAIEERAAVREFEGGEPRAIAEQEARSAMRVYDLQVAMGDGQAPRWVTVLAPDSTLVEAWAEAEGRSGGCWTFGRMTLNPRSRRDERRG